MRMYLALALLVLGLSGCGAQYSTRSVYSGPEVTHVLVDKGSRKMYLFHQNRVLESFEIDLGFAPEGHKQFEGDGKTPEGVYYIDRRNPNSAFHLSLGISYPNVNDVAHARANGKSPGGDIFIHGQPNIGKDGKRPDWTAGCISVSNKAMEKIYVMVQNGTTISIHP